MSEESPNTAGAESRQPSSVTATRWVRRLAVAYVALGSVVFAYLLWLAIELPSPQPFTTQTDLQQVITDGQAMRDDLLRQSTLGTFQDVDAEFFQYLIDSATDVDPDPKAIAAHSDWIVTNYQDRFDTHSLSVQYLLTSQTWTLAIALLVIMVPRLWSAVLLLLFSLAGTSPVSELFAGQDLGDLFLFTIAHVLIAVAILLFAATASFFRTYEADQTVGHAWALITFGVLAVVAGVAITAHAIISESDLSYKRTQGIGATFASGLLCLSYGFSDLRSKRRAKLSSLE
ncbi:MAG: hypothetical protein AAGA03_10625 [Planctomycetota bacterium]